MTNDGLPEPAGVIIVGTQSLRAFTADQLRAAIAQERERCAKLCDQISEQLKAQVPKRGASTSPTYGGVVGAAKCAAAIRGQAEGERG